MPRHPERATFGKYEIVVKLGEGGMGEVYKARGPGLDRLLARRVLKLQIVAPETFKRFEREARPHSVADSQVRR